VKQYRQLINIEIPKMNLWIRSSPNFKYISKRKNGSLDAVIELLRIMLKFWVVQAYHRSVILILNQPVYSSRITWETVQVHIH